jgi:hypothetical protein
MATCSSPVQHPHATALTSTVHCRCLRHCLLQPWCRAVAVWVHAHTQMWGAISAVSVVALSLSYGVPIALHLWRGRAAFLPGALRAHPLHPSTDPSTAPRHSVVYPHQQLFSAAVAGCTHWDVARSSHCSCLVGTKIHKQSEQPAVPTAACSLACLPACLLSPALVRCLCAAQGPCALARCPCPCAPPRARGSRSSRSSSACPPPTPCT